MITRIFRNKLIATTNRILTDKSKSISAITNRQPIITNKISRTFFSRKFVNAKQNPLFKNKIVNPRFYNTFEQLSDEPLPPSIFDQINQVLKKGMQDAAAKNKKLLLIAGEEHDSTISFVLEAMLLFAAKESNIKQLIMEMPSYALRFLNDLPTSENNVEHVGYLAKKKFCMEVTAADHDTAYMALTTNPNSSFMITDLKLHTMREQHMAEQCLKVNNHAIFIAGGMHVKGLMENKKLADVYHVVGLNITDINPIYKNSNDEVKHLHSSSITQLKQVKEAFLSKGYGFMKRHMIIDDLEKSFSKKYQNSVGSAESSTESKQSIGTPSSSA